MIGAICSYEKNQVKSKSNKYRIWQTAVKGKESFWVFSPSECYEGQRIHLMRKYYKYTLQILGKINQCQAGINAQYMCFQGILII